MNGWNTYTIDECCDILDRFRVPLNKEQREKIQGNIPYYGANGVQDYIGKFIFDDDLILIAEDGGNFDQYATRPIAYRVRGKCWVNNHAHVLKAKDGFSQDAIFYSLVHKDVLDFIVGGTRAKLNQTGLRSIRLQLPSLPAQSKIAEILSTVDRAIEQTEALIAKYQRIKTGLMHDLLTRGIDEHGQLRDPVTHQFKPSPLGMIPVEWEVKTLGRLVQEGSGRIQTGPFGTQVHAHEYSAEGVPMVMPQDIDEVGWIDDSHIVHIKPEKAQELKRHFLQQNDAIFARRGHLSRCSAITEREEGWICGTDFMLVRIDRYVMEAEWLTRFYRHDFGQRQVLSKAVGSTMVGINTHLLENLAVLCPPITEQRSLINIIKQWEGLITTAIQARDKLRRQKTGLMQDLLTGKVSVEPLL